MWCGVMPAGRLEAWIPLACSPTHCSCRSLGRSGPWISGTRATAGGNRASRSSSGPARASIAPRPAAPRPPVRCMTRGNACGGIRTSSGTRRSSTPPCRASRAPCTGRGRRPPRGPGSAAGSRSCSGRGPWRRPTPAGGHVRRAVGRDRHPIAAVHLALRGRGEGLGCVLSS